MPHPARRSKNDGEWVEDGPARFDYDPQKMAGPRITSLGSKIKSDTGWLNAWLVDPRHYTSTTRMPDMRITDIVNEATGEVIATAEQQRADIIAYLMQFKDAEFDALPNVQLRQGPLRQAAARHVRDVLRQDVGRRVGEALDSSQAQVDGPEPGARRSQRSASA